MSRLALLLVAAATAAQLASAAAPAARAAHYVIRSSSLYESITFFQKTFGMRVLRHEENDEPCPLTCNGEFEAAWSKTMVGFETEDKAFALEVTYNYGIDEYDTGTGLQSITIAVDDVDAAVAAAEKDKYEVTKTEAGAAVIVGPDEYRYVAVPKESLKKGRAEPFVGVSLAVADVAKATAFYTEVLKMKTLEGKGSDKVVLGYAADQVPITLTATEGGKAPEISQWEGRNAFSMPAELVQSVYKVIEADYSHQIIHEMQILDEKLGKLFIAIIRDVDGYEICLVSSETFDQAVLEAADFQEPNWPKRALLLKETQDALKAAKASKRGMKSKGADEPFTVGGFVEKLLHPEEMEESELHFLLSGFGMGFIGTLLVNVVLIFVGGSKKAAKVV